MEPEGLLQHSQVPATFQSLPVPFFVLGISQLGHKTRPGHCNMQNWRFTSDWSCMCVSCKSSLQHFISVWPMASTFRVCIPCMQVPCVPERPWGGLGNIRHLHEWGMNSEGGGQKFGMWNALLWVSWPFSSLGRTLSESWMALQWGGCVPGVWT